MTASTDIHILPEHMTKVLLEYIIFCSKTLELFRNGHYL